MKQKIQKTIFDTFSLTTLTVILLFINTKNLQTSTHYYQRNTPIHIHANHQSIDILTNTLIITGNVVIKQNSINIYADQIIINKPNTKNTKNTITAYGNPFILYYSKDKNNQILITSSYLLYNQTDHIIILHGQAFLKTKNNTLQSNCIIYAIKDKYIETCKKHNNQTKIKIIINDQ